MNNPRITPRDRGLLKGAVRRVFSRSELRKQIIDAALTDYIDSSRPRVKKWGRCAICNQLTPKSYLVVDHKYPVVALESSFGDMSFDELIDRMWCSSDNLQALCESCHAAKTKAENKLRRQFKKEKRK